ncbi:MAG: hypothetical protein FJ390_04875 [Verrucomicrobia bacterium]|nr:hypothetical protein [Verrucomicrobiota bacterium]
MLSPDQLLQKTAERLPSFRHATLQPIYEGGSVTRQFYRVQNAKKESLILIQYSAEKAENLYYAEHALFLKNKSINVPEVLEHDKKELLLWLQDLGEQNLYSQHATPWEKRSAFYQATLKQVARLHRIPLAEISTAGITLQQAFDKELYFWEQNYFLDNALGGLFGIEEKIIKKFSSSEAFQKLATTLASLPRQLIHRDFQSQNIIFFKNEAYFIDFQGMRAGLAAYDLASLLYDPYVSLTTAQRKELMNFYLQEMDQRSFSFGYDFKKVFFQCAAQRLMQALGCYGYLGLQHGKKKYLDYVAPALKNLQEVLPQLDPEDRLEELEKVLDSIAR